MTNEPPTGDGEELVEADPPRPTEPSASDRLDPTASNAMEVGESGEAYEFESRSDAFKGMPSGDAVWRDTPPIPSLLGEVQELASVEKETVDEAAIDNDPGDSVFDDLTYKVIDAMAGNIDPPIVAPTSGTDELESNDGSDATAQTDDLGRGPASGAGQQLDLSQMPGKFRPPADELVMILNAFDTNFDSENEVYAANTVASYYMQEPIRVRVGQLVRMYVVNLTEFDLLNSLHLHGMFFDVFRTGTSLRTSESTDTIMLCQGERAILETTFRYPGDFMFHAHQSEFAELGWMGLFRAEAPRDT